MNMTIYDICKQKHIRLKSGTRDVGCRVRATKAHRESSRFEETLYHKEAWNLNVM